MPSSSPSSPRNVTNGSSSSSILSIATTVLITSALSVGVTASLGYWYHQKQKRQDQQYWEDRRHEERTGRIRAEQKLRKALLDATHNKSNGSKNNASKNNKNGEQDKVDEEQEQEAQYPPMNLTCIGKVSSPYTKRMGTPRQGTLVPHSRGIIQLNPEMPPEVLDGISEYSHIWIIFSFHENTNLTTSKKTKIRPPRGNGIKVGQLATRSPHRPNPIGLSVVELEAWNKSKRQLIIRGFDLVNGTPVYDIKPYVHWDCISPEITLIPLRVPTWVESNDDILPNVTWSTQATTSLRELVQHHDALSPWYPKSNKNAVEEVQATLCEILAQDPRSSHKGITKNQRGTLSTTTTATTSNNNRSTYGNNKATAAVAGGGGDNLDEEESYRLVFGSTEVEFVVREAGAHVINVTSAVTNTPTS